MKWRVPLSEIFLFAILPIGLFVAFFHLSILDPYNFGWLLRGSDNGEGALGLHAWLNDPATGLSLTTKLLNAPNGVPLLFTDSNPLLAIIVAPVARFMGPNVQFVGPWVLTCLLLQTFFARGLLKPYAPSRATLWFGVAIFMLLPTLYARYLHFNLQSHWMLLWALWIFVDPRRARDPRWWIAVLAAAALVHNYILIQVAAIWASAMLARFITARNTRDRLIVVAGAIGTFAIVVIVIGRLDIDFDFVSTGNYGIFAMALDALWNPSNPSYSLFLPAISQQHWREFEGFQYLGLGILTLTVCAPFIIWRTEPVEPVASLHRRLLWLIPAALALTLLAVSNSFNYAGRTIFELPLSPAILAALDPIRASGRLFWAVSYTLLLAVITIGYRLSVSRATQLLLVAVVLQFLDMTGMMSAIRRVNAAADDHKSWLRTRDPRWATAISSAKDVTFAPPEATAQLDLFQEVAWRAVAEGKPVRVVYSARDTRITRERLAAEQADFNADRLAPDRLYVLLPSAVVPPSGVSRLAILDGVRVLLPVPSKTEAAADQASPGGTGGRKSAVRQGAPTGSSGSGTANLK